MSDNVIRTGVSCDLPCPDAPDDGWEWLPVIVDCQWRLLRCRKRVALREGEEARYTLDSAEPEIIRTRP